MPRGTPGSTEAKNNPVVLTKTNESGDTTPAQNEPRVMKSEGPAAQALDPVGKLPQVSEVIEVKSHLGDPEKLAMLAFMNEKIDVRLATSTDKEAEQVVEINVNGTQVLLRRGEVKTVPRFIVDRLARVKITSYRQEEVVNKEGVRQIVNLPNTGLRYDFSVVRDPSPYADAWLRSVINERG